jgi:hypothetical protein
MKIRTFLAFAILTSCPFAIYGLNYSDAYRINQQRYGTTPAAGESPDAFRSRVAGAQERESFIQALAEAKSQLADVKARIIRIEIQLKTGTHIPEDEESEVKPLSEEQKSEMLRELVKLGETQAWLESRCQSLSTSISKNQSRIEQENQRREIERALSRQTEDIRREIEDELRERHR